jgi:thymidine phosphorylase
MESIPGWRAELAPAEMVEQLRTVGAVICAAGPGLAPADRKLYALRDVTGTVESIPLIASSIMSKKIAEGTAALVLDVKVGSGAFMRDVGAARDLAETMVRLGLRAGVPTTAVLSRMDTPLGRACGNALEVAEAVEVLAGGGPADVVELTVTLAREMLALIGLADLDPGLILARGEATATWRAMVVAQGGDPDAALPVSGRVHEVRAERSGFVTRLDALGVGMAAWRLGAGRARKEDPVSPTAGVVCAAKQGETVVEGQPVLQLHVDDPSRLDSALEALAGAITIGSEPIEPEPLVIDVIRP